MVHFAAVNSVTARLLQLLQLLQLSDGGKLSGEAACLKIAGEFQHSDPAAVLRILHFGAETLADLRRQGVILGVLQ